MTRVRFRDRSGAAARTIPELFDAAVSEVPDKTWLLHEDEEFTYEEAHARDRTRRGRRSREQGIGRGDLVLATARNQPGYLFAWLATVRLGAIFVPVDPSASEAELAGLIDQVQPAVVITDDELARPVRRERLDAAPSPARPDDPAVLIPTSGTTGRSKLVTQTHRAYAMAGEGFPWWMELTADDRLMTSLPLFHINAPPTRCSARWPRGRASCCCRGSRRAPSSTRPAATAPPSSTRSARCSRS